VVERHGIPSVPKYIQTTPVGDDKSGMTSRGPRFRVARFRPLAFAALVVLLTVSVLHVGLTSISAVIVPRATRSNMLLGIFSVRTDTTMRELHRELFRDYDFVCSLDILLNPNKTQQCRIVYTFVIGALIDGETFNGNVENSAPDDEAGVTLLSIKENMNHGKTMTWFSYASRLCKDADIHYIAKVDIDTMMRPDLLLRFIDRDLPPPPIGAEDMRKRYGGILMDFNTCGGFEHCKIMRGNVYMSGQFYFVSTDLVHSVVSTSSKHIYTGYEDLDFGLAVFGHPEAINLVVLSREVFWIHTKETKSAVGWKRLRSSAFQTLPQSNQFLIDLDVCLQNQDCQRKSKWFPVFT